MVVPPSFIGLPPPWSGRRCRAGRGSASRARRTRGAPGLPPAPHPRRPAAELPPRTPAARPDPAPRALLERLGLVDAHRRLLGRVPRLHVQVVRRLDAPLPRGGVDRHHVAEVARLEVHVAADRLVDPLLRAGRDLEEGVRRELEARLVRLLDRVRDGLHAGDVTLAPEDLLPYPLPQPLALQ